MTTPLSFIAEYSYCPRSAYYLLTNAPKSRDEFIQSGRLAHQKVDSGYKAAKANKKIETSVRIFSQKFNIAGKIDILEFYLDDELMPVEIKRGKVRDSYMHQIQLALTALCLQENFPQKIIKKGAIFFAQDRQRKEILFSSELLESAANIALAVNHKIKNGLNPKDFLPQKDGRCIGCCFYNLCYI